MPGRDWPRILTAVMKQAGGCMNIIFVVGNRFREFATNEGVRTISDIEGMIRAEELKHLPPDTRLVAGQGLREVDIRRIGKVVQRLARSSQDGGIAFEPRPVRAGLLLTHKYQLQNSIVSTPERLSDDLFESILLLDERSELMNDHQTGQHIQGMVLIEASRQMFLAVTEEYFIGYDDPTRYYFVINSMDAAFTAFVFPMEATLRYEIVKKRVDNRARMYFRIVIAVMQAGKCATRISYEFTAFHADRIEAKEREQAAAAVSFVREACQAQALSVEFAQTAENDDVRAIA